MKVRWRAFGELENGVHACVLQQIAVHFPDAADASEIGPVHQFQDLLVVDTDLCGQLFLRWTGLSRHGIGPD